MTAPEVSRGVWSAGLSFLIWGLFPLYWSGLGSVPGLQLLAHRVVWCAFVVWLWLLLRRDVAWVRDIAPRTLVLLGIGALLIAVNWAVYVIAVTTGHVVDTSLGYFITPLANILLAVLVLRERLNRSQMLAVAVAAAGVTWLGLALDTPPWVALALACSFGLYGLVRKLAPFPALHGLAVESGVLLVPAVLYLLWCESSGTGAFLHGRLIDDVLMVLGGPVTAIPLVLFAYGAQRVSMTLLGVLQYIAPTVALVIGVLWMHEPFGVARQIAFGAIWVALAIFTVDGVRRYRRARPELVA